MRYLAIHFGKYNSFLESKKDGCLIGTIDLFDIGLIATIKVACDFVIKCNNFYLKTYRFLQRVY